MSYYHCGHPAPDRSKQRHEDCNGYRGPLDNYVCTCKCHDGNRAEDRRTTPV